MAQLVKRLTLDFSSGHDLMVCEIEPPIGADSVEPAWDSLSLRLSLPFPCSRVRVCARALSLSNKYIKIKKLTLEELLNLSSIWHLYTEQIQAGRSV